MGISSLRSSLQSLCCNSPWNYAVFWKLKHQVESILVWEDGYCENGKLREPVERTVNDFDFKNTSEILSSGYKSSIPEDNPSKYPIALAVAEMSNAYHAFGKGVVGEVASTGNPHWIYSDSMSADVVCSALAAEGLQEWMLQLLAGIKTILLLPVLPHGVLQLGSMEVVAEDAALGAYLKAEFETHETFEAYDGEPPIQQFSFLSTLMDNVEERVISDIYKMNENQKAIPGPSSVGQNLPTANLMMPVHMNPDFRGLSVPDVQYNLENVTETKIRSQSLGMLHAAEPQLNYHPDADNKSDITETNILKSVCLEEKVSPFPYSDGFDTMICGEHANGMTDIYSYQGVTVPTVSANNFDDSFCESGGNILSFPRDCELHKALGQAATGNHSQYPYDLSFSSHNVACSSVPNSNFTSSMEFLEMGTHGFPVKDENIGCHLEDLIANECNNSDDHASSDHLSDKFNHASSMRMSCGIFPAPRRTSQSKCVALVEEDQNPLNFAPGAVVAKGSTNVAYLSPSASSIESTMSVLTREQQQRKGYGSKKPVKGLSVSSTNKGRIRAGDNRRPKPRDRQLIQDRIKELRELVPNGAKCSIDGLLDRTVKHMLFLRSVTDRADKLKQQALEEGTDENIPEEPTFKSNHQNGTSWAVELGSEQQVYPIVVKDLEHPGHMLIQMLCNDRNRFLEIADVIYGLQLTVLKGVMERRSDNNTWACFIVEASRNFHRLDIFWPLMQLVQQTQTPISSKI